MLYILSLIQNFYPNLWVQAFLRVKSFLSFEKKINHTLVEAWKTHKDIQYDELTQKLIHELNYGLNDILAYRFIIHGETEEQAILTLYQIANFLIPEMEKFFGIKNKKCAESCSTDKRQFRQVMQGNFSGNVWK